MIMTYQFDTDIAAQYGVDEAVMISNLEYWIRHNIANDKHYHDGRYWTYNSIEAFTKLFPFWTARQIRRIIQSLIDQGVLMTGNYNSSARDRTMWYAFSDGFYQNRQMHLTKTSNGNDETVKCNCNNEINIQIENADNKPADGGLFPVETGFVPVTITRPHRTAESAACLFMNSRYADYDAFAAEFNAPEFQNVDIAYYFHAVADWSSSKGKKMKDWIATARNFIRGDAEKGKLHRLNSGKPVDPDMIEYLTQMAQ